MPRLQMPPLTIEDYELAAQEYCRALPLEHFMGSTFTGEQRMIAISCLKYLETLCPDLFVRNELLVQYPREGGIGQVVPDNMLMRGNIVHRDMLALHLPWETGEILLVMEWVTERTSRKDYEESFQKYERDLKVPYCVMFQTVSKRFDVWRHTGRKYREVEANSKGRHPLPDLELEVGVRAGWVRFWYRGKLLPIVSETATQIQESTRKQREANQEARRQSERAESEKLRAETEKNRAEAEKLRADVASAELARLKAELARIRSDQ